MFDKLLGLVPSWVPFAVIGALVLALGLGFLELRSSWQAEGGAKFAAAVNAGSLVAYSDQVQRNQAIDQKLERIEQTRATATKEIVREIYVQPSSDACRNSAPMRALNGRLRSGAASGDGDGPAPVVKTPDPVRPPGRPSRRGRRPGSRGVGGRDVAARTRLRRQGRRLDRMEGGAARA